MRLLSRNILQPVLSQIQALTTACTMGTVLLEGSSAVVVGSSSVSHSLQQPRFSQPWLEVVSLQLKQCIAKTIGYVCHYYSKMFSHITGGRRLCWREWMSFIKADYLYYWNHCTFVLKEAQHSGFFPSFPVKVQVVTGSMMLPFTCTGSGRPATGLSEREVSGEAVQTAMHFRESSKTP